MGSDAVERQHIKIARVLCIFFMISVHVPPAVGEPSYLDVGLLAPLSEFWINWLGRASVAALSCLSGYLLVRSAAEAATGDVASRRLRSLIVPMLVWNLAFLALLLVRDQAAGEPLAASLGEDPAAILGAVTGLTGPTANESLFFLRDLFVALLAVHLALPLLRRFAWPLLGAVALLSFYEIGAPVIFRPSILLFVMIGAIAALRGRRLAELATPGRMGLAAAVFAVLYFLLDAIPPDPAGAVPEAASLARRALMVVLVFAATVLLAGSGIGRLIGRIEPHIFLAFLLHQPLIAVLWAAWTGTVGDPLSPAYPLFFVAMPFVSIAAAVVLGRRLRRVPAWAQVALSGKVRGDAGGPAATAPAGAAGG